MTFSPFKCTEHRKPDPNTLSAIKISVLLYYFCACVFFKFFSRDLNGAKEVKHFRIPLWVGSYFPIVKYSEICYQRNPY